MMLVATERGRLIGEVLATQFYDRMVTPPEHRIDGSREDFHRLMFAMISNRMTRWEDAMRCAPSLRALDYEDDLSVFGSSSR